MSIRMSVRIFAISTMLLPALLNKPASAQYYNTPSSQGNAPLELNPFLHGAATPARTSPEYQVTPVLQYAPEEQPRSPAAQRPQSEPEQPQTSRLSVAKPNVKKQKVVKREVPIAVKHELRAEVQREPLTAEPTAARRSASMHEIQIGQPPSAPSASAAVARGTSTTANASAPAEVVAQAGQIPSSDPVVAGVRIVAADEFTELDLA